MIRLLQYAIFPIGLGVFSFALALEWVNYWLRARRQLSSFFPAGYLAAGLVVGIELLSLILAPGWVTGDVQVDLYAEVFSAVRLFLFTTTGLVFAARCGLPGLPVLGRWLKLRLPPDLAEVPALPAGGRLPAAAAALGVVAAALLYSWVLFALAHPQINAAVPEALKGTSQEDAASFALPALLILLASSIGEELIFRLGMQSFLFMLVGRFKLNRRYWQWAALAIPAVVWAAGHVSLDPDWVKPLQILPLGLALGWLARRYSIESSIVAHALFNFGWVALSSLALR